MSAVSPSERGPAEQRGSGIDAPAGGGEAQAGDFERLRELLLGDDRRELAAARARITELEARQKELPRRLPDAALEALRHERGNPRIGAALSEPVAQALGGAVQKNRQGLVDALFPILGPMIRKSIAEALRNLVGNLNSAVESSLTPRGLKWRIEAWRGGVPYAQVVLRHRLAYGIDQLFLIERESGLVLHHASAPGLPALDADAIAGMLTALGDFVDDSIGDDRGGALDSAQVGDYLVWIEHGPRANLACFMRGVPPAELRTLLRQRLEEVHVQFLALPEGTPAQAIGEDALVRQLLDPADLMQAAAMGGAAAAPAGSRWPLLVLLLAALLAGGWIGYERLRWNQRVDSLRQQLAMHPGFVLTGIDGRPGRALDVRGLFDPDAEPVAPLIEAAGIGPADVRLQTSGYVSTADAPLVRRALRLLAPPPGIRIDAESGNLRIRGKAPADWIERARERASWVPGVAGVRFEATVEEESNDHLARARRELDAQIEVLAALHVPFGEDLQPGAEAAATLERFALALPRARALAADVGADLVVTAVGTTDASGTDELNAGLRAQRATWLAEALAARGIDRVVVGSLPAGIEPPNRRGAQLHVEAKERLR